MIIRPYANPTRPQSKYGTHPVYPGKSGSQFCPSCISMSKLESLRFYTGAGSGYDTSAPLVGAGSAPIPASHPCLSIPSQSNSPSRIKHSQSNQVSA